LSSLTNANGEGRVTSIGLDVVGPGGCQVTLNVCRNGIQSVVRGLPNDAAPILHIKNSAVAELLQVGHTAEMAKADWDLPEGMTAQELNEILIGALQPETAGSRV